MMPQLRDSAGWQLGRRLSGQEHLLDKHETLSSSSQQLLKKLGVEGRANGRANEHWGLLAVGLAPGSVRKTQ